MAHRVPAIRVRSANNMPLAPSGSYVLYWMTASRRLRFNFALDRTIEHCVALRKPLIVFEALRCGYRWASDRLHQFILQGMADNAAECDRWGVRYYAYIEPRNGSGSGLLAALAKRACIVVTDDYPAFFLPRMLSAAARRLRVSLEAVDSNGLLPVRVAEKVFSRALDFRRHLQRELPQHLQYAPAPEPLRGLRLGIAKVARPVLASWPEAARKAFEGNRDLLSLLPIDHSVVPSPIRGGHAAARKRLFSFLGRTFEGYSEERNDPDADLTSGLSPYLHFGHISVHEIFHELTRREHWSAEKLAFKPTGAREGWWNMSASAESFLDELITWRELGFNFASHSTAYRSYASLPAWARKSLQEHARDEREHVYSLEEFEQAETHDPLWNAAQRQLIREGRIHSYLRMLWGKKILEWTPAPQQAAEIMIELNNKYALDGRDPNSYSGIFWVLGRYDRPWGPERPIFGVVRYMSSENTARKLHIKQYLRKFGDRAT